jgi:hypothetical protein
MLTSTFFALLGYGFPGYSTYTSPPAVWSGSQIIWAAPCRDLICTSALLLPKRLSSLQIFVATTKAVARDLNELNEVPF